VAQEGEKKKRGPCGVQENRTSLRRKIKRGKVVQDQTTEGGAGGAGKIYGTTGVTRKKPKRSKGLILKGDNMTGGKNENQRACPDLQGYRLTCVKNWGVVREEGG